MNDLEKINIVEVCVDIRKTLESLLEKWSSSLDKQDVSVLTKVSDHNHDGIDNVIQSINAIRCKCRLIILFQLYLPFAK